VVECCPTYARGVAPYLVSACLPVPLQSRELHHATTLPSRSVNKQSHHHHHHKLYRSPPPYSHWNHSLSATASNITTTLQSAQSAKYTTENVVQSAHEHRATTSRVVFISSSASHSKTFWMICGFGFCRSATVNWMPMLPPMSLIHPAISWSGYAQVSKLFGVRSKRADRIPRS
jgi:hypothetical protein